MNTIEPLSYLYTYSCNEDERDLRNLEMRSFFGSDTIKAVLISKEKIDPSRSPFMKGRIDIIFKARTVEELAKQLDGLEIDKPFKVVFVKNPDHSNEEAVRFKMRREIERSIGLKIKGEVDLIYPSMLFGIMKVEGEWLFGRYYKSKAVWLHHQNKPHQYSTALSTRVARAVVNIAVPNSTGIKMIDPCCGIGTVLVEALSMGIQIIGRDINPLVLPGTRENIAHFGFHTEVTLGDINDVTGSYDVAIIDMPYNLCSVITSKEKLEMIQSARRFSKKVVIVTIEPMDSVIEAAGFEIVDRCVAKKGTFLREVLVCQ
ncbi:TRM11 family SAM-dependent methyltransferase [Halalkalibacter okhensis]|uniref:RNA methyltransferase n=1 Tax=Halalkalibacter okhensis TaxID=333138 RepID=A0A0B0IA58_9BACI|nr:methyltransferase domain-containing protein [Halalkalibacter okhensis]KHF38175.1 RNA methyltransferase [Halalkalibacter okhensis]